MLFGFFKVALQVERFLHLPLLFTFGSWVAVGWYNLQFVDEIVGLNLQHLLRRYSKHSSIIVGEGFMAGSWRRLILLEFWFFFMQIRDYFLFLNLLTTGFISSLNRQNIIALNLQAGLNGSNLRLPHPLLNDGPE